MADQPGYTYWVCRDGCGFDLITKVDHKTKLAPTCPMCAEDSGHIVPMKSRVARTTDKVEGKDARYG